MKCALVIGHSKKSQGVVNKTSGMTEYKFNKMLAHWIKDEVSSDMELVIVERDTLETLPDKVNELCPDFVVEMHCNAFDGNTFGSEVLLLDDRSADEETNEVNRKIAQDFQDCFIDDLNMVNRGIKYVSYGQRGVYLLSRLYVPAVITEPFFIDNDVEFRYIGKNLWALVRAYGRAINLIGMRLRDND